MKLEVGQAERLQRDDAFLAIIDYIKSEQIKIFANSHRDELDAREEAHAILRAVGKIEQAIQSVITDDAIKMKRKK